MYGPERLDHRGSSIDFGLIEFVIGGSIHACTALQ